MDYDKKNKIVKAAILTAVVLVLAFFVLSLDYDSSPKNEVSINEGLLTVTDFSVADETLTDTYANGTIFVSEKNDKLLLKVVSNIYVGETDLGGVAFYFSPDFKFENAMCSYRGETSGWYVIPFMVNHPDPMFDDTYNTRMEVARMRKTDMPSGGGYGTVIFELTADKSLLENKTSSKIAVEIGSTTSIVNGQERVHYGAAGEVIYFRLS